RGRTGGGGGGGREGREGGEGKEGLEGREGREGKEGQEAQERRLPLQPSTYRDIKKSWKPRPSRDSTRTSPIFRRATTRWSASAASRSPAARSSVPRWRGPS